MSELGSELAVIGFAIVEMPGPEVVGIIPKSVILFTSITPLSLLIQTTAESPCSLQPYSNITVTWKFGVGDIIAADG